MKGANYTETQIRLFLSVDISGSTDLKNAKNYMNLLSRYNDLRKIHSRIVSSNLNNNQCDEVDDSIIFEILENEELDWITIIKNTFLDFHNMFVKELNSPVLFPWKVLGDELIYSIPIKNRDELYKNLLAFYKTLRKYDKDLRDKNSIRLKGSAWTASFPIRNRVIEIPCPQLYLKDTSGKEILYPYPKEDYLGPEMDIGFRLGKCVSSGFIVISIELAYLLGDVDSKDQFKIANVGWAELRGVWSGRYYPIYWLALPNLKKNTDEYQYEEYYLWETETNKFLSKWHKIKNDKLVEAKDEREKIESIITKLPTKLGLQIPYFPTDKEYMGNNTNILELSKKLDEYRIRSSKQEDSALDSATHTNTDIDIKLIDRIDDIANKEKLAKNI